MSAAVAAAAAAALSRRSSETRSRSTPDSFYQSHQYFPSLTPQIQVRARPLISRYECQKRRDWDSFRKYLRSHRPTLSLARCSGANVIEFLCYLDEFGQTKVHADTCTNFGHLYPANPCACPARQPWSSLVALTNRLRVAFEENGGNPVTNPFNTIDVRVYLNEVKDSQDRSRGIDQYE